MQSELLFFPRQAFLELIGREPNVALSMLLALFIRLSFFPLERKFLKKGNGLTSGVAVTVSVVSDDRRGDKSWGRRCGAELVHPFGCQGFEKRHAISMKPLMQRNRGDLVVVYDRNPESLMLNFRGI